MEKQTYDPLSYNYCSPTLLSDILIPRNQKLNVVVPGKRLFLVNNQASYKTWEFGNLVNPYIGLTLITANIAGSRLVIFPFGKNPKEIMTPKVYLCIDDKTNLWRLVAENGSKKESIPIPFTANEKIKMQIAITTKSISKSTSVYFSATKSVDNDAEKTYIFDKLEVPLEMSGKLTVSFQLPPSEVEGVQNQMTLFQLSVAGEDIFIDRRYIR